MKVKMITVERVQSEDLMAKVQAIRTEVFVIEQACPPELEWEFEEESTHYIALVDGVAAGTARWRITPKGVKLERFAVLKEYRNQEVGKALLVNILNETSGFGQKRYLHAQVAARSFYERQGFKPVGEHFWEVGIEHIKMELV